MDVIFEHSKIHEVTQSWQCLKNLDRQSDREISSILEEENSLEKIIDMYLNEGVKNTDLIMDTAFENIDIKPKILKI